MTQEGRGKEHGAEKEHVTRGKANYWRGEGNVHESKCQALFSFLFSRPMKDLFFGSKSVLPGSRWLADAVHMQDFPKEINSMCVTSPWELRAPWSPAGQGAPRRAPAPGQPKGSGQSTPCQNWMFIHASCAQLSTVPRSSPAEPQPSPPVVGDAASAAASPAPPLQPGWAQLRASRRCSGVWSHAASFGWELVQELLNCSRLLPSDGWDAWSVSSVKGFLKYKVLMKSCLVEQYRLTRLLKKVLFKVPNGLPMAYQQSGMKSRGAGEQGTIVPCFDMQVSAKSSET